MWARRFKSSPKSPTPTLPAPPLSQMCDSSAMSISDEPTLSLLTSRLTFTSPQSLLLPHTPSSILSSTLSSSYSRILSIRLSLPSVSSWMWCAIIVWLLMSVHLFEAAVALNRLDAVQTKKRSAAVGGGGVSVGRGQPVVAAKGKGVDTEAIKDLGRKLKQPQENQKANLLKQVQDHEQEMLAKQSEMRKRELLRQQRQQNAKQHENEQKWVEDIKQKAARVAQQKQADDFNIHKNKINSNNNKDNVNNNNDNIKNYNNINKNDNQNNKKGQLFEFGNNPQPPKQNPPVVEKVNKVANPDISKSNGVPDSIKKAQVQHDGDGFRAQAKRDEIIEQAEEGRPKDEMGDIPVAHEVVRAVDVNHEHLSNNGVQRQIDDSQRGVKEKQIDVNVDNNLKVNSDNENIDNNKLSEFDNNHDGVIKRVNDNNNNNDYNANQRNEFNQPGVYNVNNNMNVNNGRHELPPMGGININWDWEDFSIMFENYGGAEMKVRRAPHPTTGEPWPMPQYYSKKDNKVYKISRDLRFVPTTHTCDILDEAMARHMQRVLRGSVEDMYDNLQNAEGSNIEDPSLKYEKDEFTKAQTVTRVELRLRKACAKYPTLESDESYDLVVKKKKTFIYANEVWGILRGLETFGHLVWRGTDGILYIKETVISDYPRFPHRGLHIDTSRHYLFKEVLLDIMDSMEMNKLNVFHWHIVDDQSFPYESKVYPELSRKGAFHPTYVYSLEDVAELVEYGRMRGIRVIPEFDTPGHTYSWGLSRPELLTQCYSGSNAVKGYLGPMDPTKNSTYRFLSTLFQEVMDVFKDQFLHLGGDEVPLGCWQSNPEVMAFANALNRKHQEVMAKQPSLTLAQQQQQQNYNYGGGSWNMWSEEIKRVYEYYENRLIKLLSEIGRKRKTGARYIMWQEVMNNNLQLPNDTIIQVWMGDMGDVMRATSMGYNVLYSTCWYLDHIEYGTKWPKYYQCDPVDTSYGYHIDEKKVLGGEAAFWSEYFSNENLIPLMWPRASAAAERLWSNKEVKDLDKAAIRLSEHRCRMIKRGINAGEISGPGYCLHSPPKRRLFNDTVCKGGNCSRLHNFVEIEDIQVHVSQRGGGLSDCRNVFSRSDTGILVLLILICVFVLLMITLNRSSSRMGRMRHWKHRITLLVFLILLFIYFLCYTTIGLRAFEFSGSIHKTFQEDKRGHNKDSAILDDFHDSQKRLIS